jgi:hypothetical protein
MRFLKLRRAPVPGPDADDQLSLPFADYLPPPPQTLVTHTQIVEIGDRRKGSYQLTVHQDPASLLVLAYCLRPVTKH